MCLIIVMQNKVFINCGRSSMFSQALSLNNTILCIEKKNISMWTSKGENCWKSTKDEGVQLSLPMSPFKAPTRG